MRKSFYFLFAASLSAIKVAAHASGGAGANLAQNPHFDTDLSGWTSSNPSFTSWTNAQDHHGQGSAGVGAASIASTGMPEFLSQCVPGLNPSGRYAVSVFAKSVCGSSAQLAVYWADEECNVSGIPPIASTTLSNTWQRLTFDGVAPEIHSPSAVIVLQNSDSCTGKDYFDDVSIIQDNVFDDGFEP